MKLDKRKIAILATDGFEESELTVPLKALKEAGANTVIVSPDRKAIKSWKDGNLGKEIDVDMTLDSANSDDFDALLIPGGVINPDKLRDNEKAVNFVKGFFKESKQKPVAAICHGPMVLINAEAVAGRTMTSFSSIKKDLKNAGANWVDREVVVDKGLVTSRTPEDLEPFLDKMIEEFREGVHSIPR